jgi:hypothetical protein
MTWAIWDNLMNFDITNFQTLARHLPVEGAEIAPLIQQVAATSISEIDRQITDLQKVRNHLQSEGGRVEREMLRYTELTQMATFTAKIIFDAISQWHPAINRQKPSASEATVASTEDDMGVLEKDHHQGQRHTSEVGEDADA